MLHFFSIGGLSFMNTPIGKGQNFTLQSSLDVQSSSGSYVPRNVAMKKSATTENVTTAGASSYFLFNSDSSLSDPPSTIIKSTQPKFNNLGSDEKKIISGFMSTPLLVVKTPLASTKPLKRDLPNSPLQKISKKSSLSLFSDSSNFLVQETSSIERGTINTSSSTTRIIEETCNTSGSSNCSNNGAVNNSKSPSSLISNISKNIKMNLEHENFQTRIKSKLRENQERIENQALFQARKLQKLKAGPTKLPAKSTKPLTVPKSFSLGCDGRAQQKKLNAAQSNTSAVAASTAAKVIKQPHKFVPTLPQLPLFPSKMRPSTLPKHKDQEEANSNIENKENSTTSTVNHIRRKFEFRPQSKITVPKSPKLASIHRNRSTNKTK
jgi:hypothetical protein